MGQKVDKNCVPEEVPEELKHVYLKGVQQTGEELGNGAYGRVFKVKHNDQVYAAKEIHQILIDTASVEESETLKNCFVQECLRCKSICHENIVGFKGIYSERDGIPIMVMELMHSSLRIFLERNAFHIKTEQKISILQDVSNGLLFLHTRDPIIIHRDLSTNNIMLTSNMVAKIGDLGVAKVLTTVDGTKTNSNLTGYPGTPDFMPPEALIKNDPDYGTPIDVFSFAVVALHVFSEKWPTPSCKYSQDLHTDKVTCLSEAARRQEYIDMLTGRTAVLKQLIEKCLNGNPNIRPSIEEVYKELDMMARDVSMIWSVIKCHVFVVNCDLIWENH